MDPILTAKSTSMADIFGLLLGIYQGPNGLDNGRIHRRMMTYDACQFHQYIFHEKGTIEGAAWPAVRYLSAEFHQWDGYFYLWGHEHKAIQPYLPRKVGLSDVKQGFNHQRFRRESISIRQLHSLSQIEDAAQVAMDWLAGRSSWVMPTNQRVVESVRQINAFKKSINSTGVISIEISQLANLMGK